MTKETSIYLDMIRFIAACLVVIYHTSGMGVTGGFLWQISGYGSTSVMVFFVLSGYVIGFVVHTKEKNISDYLISRLSRLYSIIIPAIILTLVCNFLGPYTISDYYQGPWNEAQPQSYIKYITSLFMLQNIWGIDLIPRNNGAFWSLSYEFFYYLLFAALFFYRGKKRFLITICIITIAGPAIITTAPIWGLGYFAYRLNSIKNFELNPIVAVFLFSLSLVILAFSPIYRDLFRLDFNPYKIFRSSIISDYIDGMAFFIHIVSIPYVIKKASKLLIFIKPGISWLANLTFSIYLFHLPLVRLVAGTSPFVSETSSYQHIIFVYSVTFSIIILIGLPAERSKKLIKKRLYQFYSNKKKDTGIL